MHIKDKINKLEQQLNVYKDKICLHIDTSSYGYNIYYGGDIYICNNCGRVLVSESLDYLNE